MIEREQRNCLECGALVPRTPKFNHVSTSQWCSEKCRQKAMYKKYAVEGRPPVKKPHTHPWYVTKN